MKIGAYTICKNERKYIDRWVQNFIDLDDICILDTGSTDGTYEHLLELEKQYPNLHVRQKTYETFYFDVARNDSLDFVWEYFEEGDWLFVIDIDEYLSSCKKEEMMTQLNNAQNWQDIICVLDVDGCWHWKGHRLKKDFRWIFHVHETLADVTNKKIVFSNDFNFFLHNIRWYHTQEQEKPRGYNNKLRDLIAQEPTNIHYLVMGLYEELHQNPQDDEYVTYLRTQIIDNVCNNKEDWYYKDLSILSYACTDIDINQADFALTALLHEEPNLTITYPDFRGFHLAIAELLVKMENFNQESLQKIEEEYLKALQIPVTGWQVESNFTDDYVLLRFLMFLFYCKKDYISASFYAQQFKELDNSSLGINNYNACTQHNEHHRSWVLLLTSNNYIDGVITTVKTLQSTNTQYPISILVTKDICIENIRILLSLGLHIFLVNKIKPTNSGDEVALIDLETFEQPGFHAALSKFYIYNLTFFDKIVYLDSDIWVLKNIDDLFEKPNYSAINNGCGIEDLFCSALIVVEPNTEVYNDILLFFKNNYSNRTTLVHDQEVLQQYFKDYWYAHPELQLPIEYCLWTTYYQSGIKDFETAKREYYFNLLDIKTYHMIYKKPWTHGKKYFEQFKDTDPCYYSLVCRYIELVNYCVQQIKNKGLDSPYLVYIE